MAKKKMNVLTILIILVVGYFVLKQGGMFQGAISGSETVSRMVPATTTPGSVFEVVYTVEGGVAPWAVSIEDSVNGGCTPIDSLKFVIASEPLENACVSPCVRQIQAPGSDAVCDFSSSGSYKFGNLAIVPFNNVQSISISENCNTPADNNPCDGLVSNQELIGYITQWVNNLATNQELLDAITAWTNS